MAEQCWADNIIKDDKINMFTYFHGILFINTLLLLSEFVLIHLLMQPGAELAVRKGLANYND